jgi:hypothetical protein
MTTSSDRNLGGHRHRRQNVGVTSDFFGDPRPQGGGFDAGYDESPYSALGAIVSEAR